jgi:uroporphyrinogen-III synthase
MATRPVTPRVLITREDPAPLAEAVARAGGVPVVLPLLTTRWLPFALPEKRRLEDYDWVAFTSVRALDAVVRHVQREAWVWPPETRCAAVGDRTAHELQAQGWMPECVSDTSTARGLLQSMATYGMLGARVLFPCSAIAEKTLPDGLRTLGAVVDVVPVYTTTAVWDEAPEKLPFLGRELAAALRSGCVATCASPSAARALVDLASASGALETLRTTPIAVLGPTTARTAHELGLRSVESEGRTLACLARKAVELGRMP